MKKLFLTGISLLFAVSLTFAQQVNPEEKAKEVTTELTQKLTLTAEQQTAIYPLILDGAKVVEGLKADSSLAPEVLAEQVENVQKTVDTKVSELLTEEQKPVFFQLISERPKDTVAPVAPVPPVQKEEPTKSEE